MADLHRTMNVHMKPPSVAAEDEGAWQGVWPTGRMGGKKGDILKLVMVVSILFLFSFVCERDQFVVIHLPLCMTR